MALPCYPDDHRGLQALIDEELGAAGLKIAPELRRLLSDQLGGDRLASRGELRKLALYCAGQDRVEEADIVAIMGDASALSVDQAVDCVLTGDLVGLDHALARIVASKTPIAQVLQACLRQFQTIDVVRGRIDGQRQPPAKVIGEAARRMHFRRKPAFEQAARAWPGSAVAEALQALNSAVLDGRRQPTLQDSLARHTLLAIAQRSGRLTRRPGH